MMDQMKGLSFRPVSPSTFGAFEVSVSNEIAAEETNLQFSFEPMNPITGSINISLPINYSFGDNFVVEIMQPAGLSYNVSVETYANVKHVASIFVTTDIEAYTDVVIVLRGLVNGQYPGDIEGFISWSRLTSMASL